MTPKKTDNKRPRINKNYTDTVPFPTELQIKPIGKIHSPYKERHGTPRQSELRSRPNDYEPVKATVELFETEVPATALKDLEGFERIWIISWLHLNTNWNPTVLPPRGPRIRRGTLATRAPHRPNPIGLSAVRLLKIEKNLLIVEGVDLLDNTPILDIKPYVSYCDSFPQAKCGYVDDLEAQGAQERHIEGARTHKS